jgi:hypothetical protein
LYSAGNKGLAGHELALNSSDMCACIGMACIHKIPVAADGALSKEAPMFEECSMLKLEPAGSMAYCTKSCCTNRYTLTNVFGEMEKIVLLCILREIE